MCTFLEEARPGTLLVLHGPAGVGKTALVQTAAKESNVYLHTLRTIEKDGVNHMKRLKEFMQPRPTHKKEAFLLDPFEEFAGDLNATRNFISLVTSDKAKKCGRAFIVVVNDLFSKGNQYHPLRRVSHALCAQMYTLNEQSIRRILVDHGLSLSKEIRAGIRVARGDGRQAVTFAKDRQRMKGVKALHLCDLKMNKFDAVRAVFEGGDAYLKRATSCPDQQGVLDMVRENLLKVVPSSEFESDEDRLKTLDDVCEFYDALALREYTPCVEDIPFIRAKMAAERGNPRQKLDMPCETFRMRMKQREIEIMDFHLLPSVEAGFIKTIIDSSKSFWCTTCNEKFTKGEIYHCPHAEKAFQKHSIVFSKRIADTGVNPEVVAEVKYRFGQRPDF